MRKILRNLSALLVVLSMAALPLTATAQRNSGRNSHFGGHSNSGQAGQRPSGGNNGGNHGNHNGGNHNNGNHNNGNHNNGNHNGNWNNGNHNGNHNGNWNNGNHNGNHNGNWNNGNHNGHRPSTPPPPPPAPNRYPINHGHNYHHSVPFFGSYHRPTPPPSWRPAPGYYGPSFGTILGVTLGTALDLSLRSLINSGYAVSSYGNNVIYLSNVPQMNYTWPDAAMYYNNGVLCGSTFTYPSSYYDMSRYNSLYNQFYRQYGAPISMVNSGGVISSTWYGAGNRFVTLEFNSNYGNYYTSLSFGL